MSDEFDPYVDWLGISPAEGPADHYSLLGVTRFEANKEKIVAAADARMEILRRFQNGKRSRESQQLLNEVSNARVCLLDKAMREHYDRTLRKRIDINALPEMNPPPPLFPEEPVSAQSSVLPTVAPIEAESMLAPPPIRKPELALRRIPVWVYFSVVGILSVIVMGYYLFKSISAVFE